MAWKRDYIYVGVIALLFGLLVVQQSLDSASSRTSQSCPFVYSASTGTYSAQPWVTYIFFGAPVNLTEDQADVSVVFGAGTYALGTSYLMTVDNSQVTFSSVATGGVLAALVGDSLFLGEPDDESLTAALTSPGLYAVGLPPTTQDTDGLWYSYQDIHFVSSSRSAGSNLIFRRVSFVDDASINGWQLKTPDNEITITPDLTVVGSNIYRDTIVRNRDAGLIVNATVVVQSQTLSSEIPVSCIEF